MHERYKGVIATLAFDEEHKLKDWARITRQFMCQLTDDKSDISRISTIGLDMNLFSVVDHEQETGHDVVAFLRAFEERTPPDLRWMIHFGLTSSDLVENWLHHACATHMMEVLAQLNQLVHCPKIDDFHPNYPRAGRTHGQIAEVTSFRHQIDVWQDTAKRILYDGHRLRDQLAVIEKQPGPTGMNAFARERIGLDGIVIQSTQVLPRDYLLQWAMLYVRIATHLENLAGLLWHGARAEVGEIREGTRRVGSSAMPHKSNPIGCEKVMGMARLARGYMLAIAETAGSLREDRDISNSSVERVAVPDLAHCVEHMADTMIKVCNNLWIDKDRMRANAQTMETVLSWVQALIQYHAKMPYSDAAATTRYLFEVHGAGWKSWQRDAETDLGTIVTAEVAKRIFDEIGMRRVEVGLHDS